MSGLAVHQQQRGRRRSEKLEKLTDGETMTDSGFQSPAPSRHSPAGGNSSQLDVRDAATPILSPPTQARWQMPEDTPSGGGSGGGCQYFLRAHHRWSSTPLVAKEHFLQKTMSVPATSTPASATEFSSGPNSLSSLTHHHISAIAAAASPGTLPCGGGGISVVTSVSSLAQIGQQEFEARLYGLDTTQPSSPPSAAAATSSSPDLSSSLTTTNQDSGIGSLSESPRPSHTEEEEISHIKNLGAIPKRRSPRQIALGNRLDGIDRLTRIKLGKKNLSKASQPFSDEVVAVDDTSAAATATPHTTRATVDSGGCVEARTTISSSSSLVISSSSRVLSQEGRETVDLVRCLSERSQWIVTDRILSYLPPADLCSFSLVSQVWNSTLATSKANDERRLAFVREKRLNLENCGQQITSTKIRSSPRLAMQEVSNTKNQISPATKRNRNPSSSSSTVASPSKIRYRLFVDEAAKLSPGERLVHCPYCSSPSRVELPSSTEVVSISTGLAERATCSSVKCGRVFCPACYCQQHNGACRVLRSGGKSSSKAGGVTSKKSKARLRRL